MLPVWHARVLGRTDFDGQRIGADARFVSRIERRVDFFSSQVAALDVFGVRSAWSALVFGPPCLSRLRRFVFLPVCTGAAGIKFDPVDGLVPATCRRPDLTRVAADRALPK